MKKIVRTGPFCLGLGLFALCSAQAAAPVPGQISPVATYNTIPGEAFGLAYDSVNDLMWVSTFGDNGHSGSPLLSFKPFKNYTSGEIGSLPIGLGGLPTVSPTDASLGTFETSLPGGSTFKAIAFDGAQLVGPNGSAPDSGTSADPKTSGNPNGAYRPGSFVTGGFSPIDGLDIGPTGDLWLGAESSSIYRNGAIFANNTDAAVKAPGFDGGWHGVAEIGGFIYGIEDVGGSVDDRTITKHSIATGELVAYDPDGDDIAARWEDIAFDGRYLYAASLFNGTIDVFDLTGGLTTSTPDSMNTLTGLLAGCGALLSMRFARRKG